MPKASPTSGEIAVAVDGVKTQLRTMWLVYAAASTALIAVLGALFSFVYQLPARMSAAETKLDNIAASINEIKTSVKTIESDLVKIKVKFQITSTDPAIRITPISPTSLSLSPKDKDLIQDLLSRPKEPENIGEVVRPRDVITGSVRPAAGPGPNDEADWLLVKDKNGKAYVLNVGDTVPETIESRPVPRVLYQKIPKLRGKRYVTGEKAIGLIGKDSRLAAVVLDLLVNSPAPGR